MTKEQCFKSYREIINGKSTTAAGDQKSTLYLPTSRRARAHTHDKLPPHANQMQQQDELIRANKRCREVTGYGNETKRPQGNHARCPSQVEQKR
jgi:hypothetical protein